ncbi:hypothetical protein [Nocardiopsis synnemataformans]|uniref:hypothetical protein n=1 Tax=Nocardiopsis synnemataformans TaxID=61305 RepID=UPI003EB75E31
MKKSTTKKLLKNTTLSPKHGPIMGAINLSGGLWGVSALTEAGWIEVAPVWALGLAGAGMALSQVRAHVRGLGVGNRVYRACCWVAAGGWSWWTLTHGVWDVTALSAGAGMAFVAALGAPVAADLERVREERQVHKVENQARWDLGRQWVYRLDSVCNIKGAQVKGLTKWKHEDPATGRIRETGYSIEFLLPVGAKGWDTVNNNKAALINHLDLPVGCSISIERGKSARRVVIHVTTVNVLVKDIPLPEPKKLPASINDPLWLGLTTRGSAVQVPLKWTSGVVVGAKRQGKSNLLKTTARQALRCGDVLVMGIDPNGGELFLPFLRPWLEGKVDRPAIDWVAVDEEEAIRMLRFLRDSVSRRRQGYSNLMWNNGGDDKLEVSPKIPHILLLTDESKSMSKTVKELMIELNDRCGAASISMMTSWLRAVAQGHEGLPRDLLVQSETVLTVRVNDTSELKWAFGQGGGRIPPAGEAVAPGWGHARPQAGDQPQLYKSARSENTDCYDDALAYAEFRMPLDRVTVGPDAHVYDSRWERAYWLPIKPPNVPVVASAAPAKAQATPTQGRKRLDSQQLSQRSLEARNNLRKLAGKPPLDEDGNEIVEPQEPTLPPEPAGPAPASPEASRQDADAALRARFDELVAGLSEGDDDALEQEQQIPPFLQAVLEEFQRWDTDRVHRQALADALTEGDKDRLNQLMKALEIPTEPGPFRMTGHSALGSHRGWALAAVKEAAEQIRAGRPVPLEVMDWTRPT